MINVGDVFHFSVEGTGIHANTWGWDILEVIAEVQSNDSIVCDAIKTSHRIVQPKTAHPQLESNTENKIKIVITNNDDNF